MQTTIETPTTALIPANGNLVPAPRTPQPLQVESPTLASLPNLAAALAAAQAKCRSAAKDAVNDYHKYKYASAEAIIEEAKAALTGSGLAVLPRWFRMGVTGSGNFSFHSLDRAIDLMHSSGESVEMLICSWPVIPDRGRPLDKALAAALTSSLAYFLRDLLLMPRVNPSDDMSGREDRGSETPVKPAKQKPTEPRDANEEHRIGEEDLKRLGDVVREHAHRTGLGPRTLANELLAQFGAKVLSKLTVYQFEPAKQWLANHPVVASTPSAVPVTAPPTPPPPAAPLVKNDHVNLLRTIHRQLETRPDLTWRSALRWQGIDVPQTFREPKTEEDAERLAFLCPIEKAQRIAAHFQPKGKNAPAAPERQPGDEG